jgi:hypothetical protein
MTERGLARMTGVSQPHIHNVLKGVRILTPEIADAILRALQLSVLDLIPPREMEEWLRRAPHEAGGLRRIPILKYPIGPGFPWNDELQPDRTYSLPAVQVAGLTRPLIARAVADAQMLVLTGGGRLLLVDAGVQDTASIQPETLYIIERQNDALVRRALLGNGSLAFAPDIESKSGESVRLDSSEIVIRGRVVRVWSETAALESPMIHRNEPPGTPSSKPARIPPSKVEKLNKAHALAVSR